MSYAARKCAGQTSFVVYKPQKPAAHVLIATRSRCRKPVGTVYYTDGDRHFCVRILRKFLSQMLEVSAYHCILQQGVCPLESGGEFGGLPLFIQGEQVSLVGNVAMSDGVDVSIHF
jgi:hypothetical protein